MARRDAPRIPGSDDSKDRAPSASPAPQSGSSGRSEADLREAVREVIRALDCMVAKDADRPEARRHVERARQVLAVAGGAPSRTTPATPPTTEAGGDVHEDLQRSLM